MTQLFVSMAVFWLLSIWWERKATSHPSELSPQSTTAIAGADSALETHINFLKALAYPWLHKTPRPWGNTKNIQFCQKYAILHLNFEKVRDFALENGLKTEKQHI